MGYSAGKARCHAVRERFGWKARATEDAPGLAARACVCPHRWCSRLVWGRVWVVGEGERIETEAVSVAPWDVFAESLLVMLPWLGRGAVR